MASATLVPVETYLCSAYRPDCDYVEGEVLARNVGEIPHSRLQVFFVRRFLQNETPWGFEILTEPRVQVASHRYRVPDLVVVRIGHVESPILLSPPALCIEISSSEDRMGRMQERVADYHAMGVTSIWVLDPWRRVAYIAGPDGRLALAEGVLTVADSPVSVAVEEVFAELDRLEQR